MIFKRFNLFWENTESRMLRRLRRMTSLSLNRNFKIGISLFSNTDTCQISVKYALNLSRKHCSALVNNTVKANATAFKSFCKLSCAIIWTGYNFFIMTQAQIHASFWLISLFKQCFNTFQKAYKMIFHIKSTSAPDKFTVVYTVKSRVHPIFFRSLADGYNVLMSQKSNRVKGTVTSLPKIKQTCFWHIFNAQIFINERKWFFQKFVKSVKFCPIGFLLVFVRYRFNPYCIA